MRVEGAVAANKTKSTSASASFLDSFSSSATILMVESGSTLDKGNRDTCKETEAGSMLMNSGSWVLFDDGTKVPRRCLMWGWFIGGSLKMKRVQCVTKPNSQA